MILPTNFKMPAEWTIEYHFDEYLKRVGLDRRRLAPRQAIEMRRTFYAAFGIALLHLRDDVGSLEDNDAITALELHMQDVAKYFTNERNK